LTSKSKVKPDTEEVTVPALDQAINDDVERLFQKNDIEGLRDCLTSAPMEQLSGIA